MSVPFFKVNMTLKILRSYIIGLLFLINILACKNFSSTPEEIQSIPKSESQTKNNPSNKKNSLINRSHKASENGTNISSKNSPGQKISSKKMTQKIGKIDKLTSKEKADRSSTFDLNKDCQSQESLVISTFEITNDSKEGTMEGESKALITLKGNEKFIPDTVLKNDSDFLETVDKFDQETCVTIVKMETKNSESAVTYKAFDHRTGDYIENFYFEDPSNVFSLNSSLLGLDCHKNSIKPRSDSRCQQTLLSIAERQQNGKSRSKNFDINEIKKIAPKELFEKDFEEYKFVKDDFQFRLVGIDYSPQLNQTYLATFRICEPKIGNRLNSELCLSEVNSEFIRAQDKH